MRKSNQPTDRGRKHTLPLIFNWEKSRPWPCDVPHFVSLLSLLRFTTTPRSCSFTFLSWNLQAGGSSTARGCRIDWVGSRFLHLLLLLLGGRREKKRSRKYKCCGWHRVGIIQKTHLAWNYVRVNPLLSACSLQSTKLDKINKNWPSSAHGSSLRNENVWCSLLANRENLEIRYKGLGRAPYWAWR